MIVYTRYFNVYRYSTQSTYNSIAKIFYTSVFRNSPNEGLCLAI